MSTTRAGTLYKNNSSRMEEVENEARDNIDERGGVFEGGVREPMSEVMRMFVEDRQRREEEQERDRRRWLEEKRAWEITLEEERRRRDEEMVRREEHTHRQMELLHTFSPAIDMTVDESIAARDSASAFPFAAPARCTTTKARLDSNASNGYSSPSTCSTKPGNGGPSEQ